MSLQLRSHDCLGMKDRLTIIFWGLIAFLLYWSVFWITHRQLGWSVDSAKLAAVAVVILVAVVFFKLMLHLKTRVIGESTDPDLGEITQYRESWLSLVDLEGFEEPVFLSGEGTSQPTGIQRSVLIGMVDSREDWMKEIEIELEKQGGVPEPSRPWSLLIDGIELDPNEYSATVSFSISRGEVDDVWLAELQDGAVTSVSREEC